MTGYGPEEPSRPPLIDDASAGGSSGKTVFVRIALLCLGVRLALWIIGLASTGDLGDWLDLWSRWDAPHYLRIAQVGYRPLEPAVTGDDGLFIVFFPLFPVLVRAVSVAVRNLVASGLVVSYAASVAAAWFLHRLTALDSDESEGWRSVLLLVSFPTAYFLAAPYTEALFLAAVTGSMLAARTGRWPMAGAAGAAATATRVAGIALLPALAVEALRARTDGWTRMAPQLAWTGSAATGLMAYLVINRVVHGDPFFFLEVQRSHWHQQLVAPWSTMEDAVSGIVQGRATGDFAIIYWGRLAGFVLGASVLAAGWRRLRWGDRVYGWTGLLVVSSAAWLLSLPRYLLGIYPLFIVGARLTRRRAVLAAAVGVGAAAQAVLFWRYARGWWTF